MELTSEDLGNGVLRVALSGRLDTIGVDRVETRFGATVAAGGHHAIVDLSQVTFLSSMGIRMLITVARAQRARGHRMVLFAASSGVASTMAMVALDQIIPVVDDEALALARVAQDG